MDRGLRLRGGVQLVLSGREFIGLSRQHGPHPAAVLADFPQGVDDGAVLYENDVAVFSHELDDKGFCDDFPTGGQCVDIQEDESVHSVLAYVGDASCLDLLAEHHAEDGGLGRVLQWFRDEMGGRVLGMDGDVQKMVLPGLPYGKDDGMPVGLGDFVDAPAIQGVL